MSKKLINNPVDCVDEGIEGFVMTHPGLRVLGTQRVVIRDKIKSDDGKVAVITGGGAGHEPFATGFVGEGLLSAAVSGSIFASPPAGHILAAIRAANSSDNAGVLLILINYTGDRLNFGLAMERARNEGIPVAMVVCADDCAVMSGNKAVGRRGLAGSLFLMKAAGAMAEKGEPLETIAEKLEEMKLYIGTMGASLTSCCVPGAAMFHLPDDEVELGLGIHGEAGVKRIKMTSAAEIVRQMLERLTDSQSSCSMSLPAGTSVALIVNNLGGLSILEANITTREIIKQLDSKGVSVIRCYAGHVMTSLDARGIQLSLLRIDPKHNDWLNLLDAPTSAAMWPHSYSPPQLKSIVTDDSEYCWRGDFQCRGPSLSDSGKNMLQASIDAAAMALEKNIDRLNQLDSGCGDGDCGSTFGQLVTIIRETELNTSNPYSLLQQLSHFSETDVGGTTGAVYSIFFAAAACAFTNENDTITWQHWVTAGSLGVKAIMKYGKGELGDRTMIDALLPAMDRLESLPKTDINQVLSALEAACCAAEEGAAQTTGMLARLGRASYVSEDLLTGPDAGATAVSVWLRGVFTALDSLLRAPSSGKA